MASVRVGLSGWQYRHWHGAFYPPGTRRADELRYAAEQFSTLELNGTFYGLQRPSSFLRWRDTVPAGFTFAVKGSRYVTHLKRLREPRTALANFVASGLLALGDRLGPVLWQLPERATFDAEVLGGFLDALPRTTTDAARLAADHDDRLRAEAWTEPVADRPLRHALEARHASFEDPAALRLLRDHDVALVVSDGAGRWPLLDHPTAGLAYLRLHGPTTLYASRYDDARLDRWADWVRRRAEAGQDVVAYFDNDGDAHAPRDARRLVERLGDVVAPWPR
ncbi:DUF72 domain-containing protein [Isoptericola sp. NPDC019693]|uniref:DUF72 domain-containing protein n=1 Tax=Isoptericola sp. NPDC019693 TaxID=3364009 RepID=UPI0037B655FC